MKNLSFQLLIISSLLFYSNDIVAQTPAQRQTAQSFVSTVAYPGVSFGYWEYLPENYASRTNLPVVIFLHGVGEKGNGTTDLYKVKAAGPPKLINNGTNFDFICISPQTNWPYNFDPPVVNDIIEMVKAKYKINTNRIYLTGLSFGGEAVWAYGASSKLNANKLAALAPIAGWLSNTQGACNMNEVPIWGFQGEYDGNGTINAVNSVNNCNPAPVPPAIKTVYPGVGHDAWTQAYNDPNFWTWLLAQSRSGTTIGQNMAPSVSISSPSINSSFIVGSSVTISASASDIDGSITGVDFYYGNTLLGTDATSPYSIVWNNSSVGNYTLKAIATDNGGKSTTSTGVAISVSSGNTSLVNLAKNKPMTVSSINYTGTEGAKAVDENLATYWNSSVSDPLPTISVDLGGNYYIDNVVLKHAQAGGAQKEFNTADYKIEYSTNGTAWTQLVTVTGNQLSVTGYNVGLSTIRYVKLTITKTATWTGKAAQIVEIEVNGSMSLPNQAPVVSITSPNNNTSFTTGTAISVAATASDADGSIAGVDFYNGNTLLGTDATSPYSIVWNNAPVGSYTIKAIATDNAGKSTTSTGITITVTSGTVSLVNLAKNKPMTVSSINYTGTEGAKAVDENLATYWNSAVSDPLPTISVDLGGNYYVDNVVLKHAQAGGAQKEFNTVDYKIEYSTNGTTWTQLVTVTGNQSSVTGYNVGLSSIRYVKLTITKTATWTGKAAQIVEIEVNGTSNGGRIENSENLLNLQTMSLSPNPTDGQITIKMNDSEANAMFIVVDAMGREVYSTEILKNAPEYQLILPVLPSGVYLLREGYSNYTSRFVIK